MRTLALVSVLLVSTTPLFAQTIPGTPGGGTRGGQLITGQHPFDNVSGGALADRAPGNLVSQGVAAQQAMADFGRSSREIVETQEDIDAIDVFLADAVEILFDQLNLTILLFENALRARAGFPPRVPDIGTGAGGDGGGVSNAGEDADANAADAALDSADNVPIGSTTVPTPREIRPQRPLSTQNDGNDLAFTGADASLTPAKTAPGRLTDRTLDRLGR